MKKFLALALAFIMVFALATTAFAADAVQKGSITIKNATVGQKYAGYKLFDVTYSGENNENMAYTITEGNPFYDYVSGAKHDLIKTPGIPEEKDPVTGDVITSGSDPELYTAADVPFVLTAANGVEKTYNVALKPGFDDAAVIAWLQALKAATVDATDSTIHADLSETPAVTAEVKWENVPCGYYLIDSGLGAVVTVDTNTPDVTVIDKNQGVGGLTKTVDEAEVEIGETVQFTVSFNAANYDGEDLITKYTIKDDMNSNMVLVSEPVIKVEKIYNSEGEEETKNATLTKGEDYTSNANVGSSDFEINIPWVVDKDTNSADDVYDFAPLYPSSNKITITYEAKLISTASIAGEGNKNTVTLTWEDGDNDPDGDKLTDEESVSTYALAVKKVDKEGKPLEHAVFTLKNGTADVKVAVVSLAANATDEAAKTSAANIYVVDPTATTSATIESPASGLIIIKGVDNDAYTLTETAAPNGYNLLTAPVTVTPEKLTVTTTNKTIYLDGNGGVISDETTTNYAVNITIADLAATPIVVVNLTGTELPSTGGMGTTVFYVIGAVLMLGAVVVLVSRKRMAA